MKKYRFVCKIDRVVTGYYSDYREAGSIWDLQIKSRLHYTCTDDYVEYYQTVWLHNNRT